MQSVSSNAVAQTVNGLYNLPTGSLPQDANVTMSVAHILFQSGRSNPASLSNYPSITNFNSAGGGCAYTLITISANDTTARLSQFCTINYYNTSGSWVYKVYTRRKVDGTWFGWQAIL